MKRQRKVEILDIHIGGAAIVGGAYGLLHGAILFVTTAMQGIRSLDMILLSFLLWPAGVAAVGAILAALYNLLRRIFDTGFSWTMTAEFVQRAPSRAKPPGKLTEARLRLRRKSAS